MPEELTTATEEKKTTKAKAKKAKDEPKVEAKTEEIQSVEVEKEECMICASKTRLESAMASLALSAEIAAETIARKLIDSSAVTIPEGATPEEVIKAESEAALKTLEVLMPSAQAQQPRAGQRLQTKIAGDEPKSDISKALASARELIYTVQAVAEAHTSVGECDCDDDEA